MYEKILVAVDHSAVSARALEAARGLASLSHGEVWVLHLRERETMGKTGLLTSAESSDEATAQVSAAVAQLTNAGIKAHAVVRDTVFGYAAREIVSDAAGLGRRCDRDGLTGARPTWPAWCSAAPRTRSSIWRTGRSLVVR